MQVLTRRNVNAGDRDSALDHCLNDGGHVRFGSRAAESAAEQRVDDDVVGAGDEVRLGWHVRQERYVLQLALLRQLAVERRLARSARIKDGRTIVLPPQSTIITHTHTSDELTLRLNGALRHLTCSR